MSSSKSIFNYSLATKVTDVLHKSYLFCTPMLSILASLCENFLHESITPFPKQGSHSHRMSGKVMEKYVVMESHGKVMENNKNK